MEFSFPYYNQIVACGNKNIKMRMKWLIIRKDSLQNHTKTIYLPLPKKENLPAFTNMTQQQKPIV